MHSYEVIYFCTAFRVSDALFARFLPSRFGTAYLWAAFLLRAILFTWNICFPGRPFIEEIGFLPPFLLLRTGDVDFFMYIGVLPGVEHHRREGHRRRGEILYLFEVEMELAEYFRRQRAHVTFGAARV